MQHEARVRFRWAEFHGQQLDLGQKIELPFRFVVGSRRESRTRDRDRDFYSLILLGHALRAEEGRQLLLDAVHETPDFDCTVDGAPLGVEVTEAVGEDLARDRDSADRLAPQIRRLMTEARCSVHFEGDFLWYHLARDWDEIATDLRARLESGEGNASRDWARSTSSARISVERSDSPLWTHSGAKGQDGEDLKAATNRLRQLVAARIDAKLAGPMPRFRPCVLLIYANDLEQADVAGALDGLSDLNREKLGSHFDEVWVASDQGCLLARR